MNYNYAAQIKEESALDFKTFLGLIFSDGSVTDNGDGTFTIASDSGGGGGGTNLNLVKLISYF